MLISVKHRYAFFCTPKCASNSVEAMLKPHADIHLLGTPQLRHTNARQYAAHIQPYLDQVAREAAVERVAIIREPVAWLHSWYRFRARSELRNADSDNSTAHVSFSEFVDAYLSDSPPPFAQVGTQAEFLLGANGELGVDRLFAYDQLDELAKFFSDRVGQELSLHTMNVSPSKVYQSNAVERLSALWRGLTARTSRAIGGSSGAAPAKAAPTAELSEAQLAGLADKFAIETELHRAALRGPLLKTEWDGRHSGKNDGAVS